jgi:hypothetical protein
VRLQGVAAPRAQVFAYNHESGLMAGQVTKESPYFDFEIGAQVGDTLELWYQTAERESPSVIFDVPDPND